MESQAFDSRTREQPVTVLLVDDDAGHAELMARSLRTGPFEVEAVATLRSAVARLGADPPPDLVIVDHRLPDGDGLQLLDDLQGRVPAVVVTGHGDEATAVRALRAGALDYVVKTDACLADVRTVAERALARWHRPEPREADAHLRQALAELPITVVAQDTDLRITWIHDPTADPSAPSPIGHDDRALLPPDAAERLIALKRHALERGEPIRRELHLRRDGVRVYEIFLQPQRDAEGRVTGLVTTSIDATERRRQHSDRAAHERLASIGTAAAVLAHELSYPLNGMYVGAQLLERRAVSHNVEPVVEGIRTFRRQMLELNALLRDFRELARRYPPIGEPERAPVELVTEILDELEAHGMTPGVVFERDLPPEVAPIVLDRAKLKQVLVNLCSNAIDAMPDGGTMTVRLRSEDPWAVFEVSDTGPGVPEDVDIFEAFKTTKPEGAGLGLAVSRQIVYAHGGTIDFASEPGSGTTFTVCVPLHRA